MNSICILLCTIVVSYFNSFQQEVEEATIFITENKSLICSTLCGLSTEEQLMAISIVAPEISQYSSFLNFFEQRTLFVMYLNNVNADFSVGYFQMKPSFVENLEKKALVSKSLRERFKDIIPSGSEREKRKFRLIKLTSLAGQLRYLRLFIEIVRAKTNDIEFNDSFEKLRYWATLYNSGIDLNESEVLRIQTVNLFPKFKRKYNYSSVSVEFYYKFKNHGW